MFCDLKAGVILVAEDNPDEAMLLQRAFKKAGVEVRVHICTDGDEATDYLRGEKAFTDRVKFPFPNMLITDLKMPRCNGFELLERMQSEHRCSVFPRVVLSASAEDRDVQRAFKVGANCYLQKPARFEDLVSMVRNLCEFWNETLVPPPMLPLQSGAGVSPGL
jgi:CheY-like chemotaxis protein